MDDLDSDDVVLNVGSPALMDIEKSKQMREQRERMEELHSIQKRVDTVESYSELIRTPQSMCT